MAVYKKNKRAYSIGQPMSDVFVEPIVASRAPTAKDQSEIGQLWVYQNPAGTDDIFILSSVTAGSANWVASGGGAGNFDSLTVTNAAIIGTDLTVTAGSFTVGTLTAGTVRSSAAGLFSVLADGADGELLVGTTGGAAAWATLTAGGGINIAEAAGTITISNPGATGTTSGTDIGGPVSPTAGGLTTFTGVGANLSTDGATANTVKIILADDIVSVASITATNDLLMSAGTCTITSDDDNANAIYLHVDAGVNEKILIHSDQGIAADSVGVLSDVGGIALQAGLAAANSISIDASDAAGGIDVDYGTGGMTIDGANGAFTIQTGTAAINIGVDAVAHDVVIGNVTGASSLTLSSGTGDVAVISIDAITIDSTGVLELNSSGGVISIGNDAVAQAMNFGTGAAQRVVTIGNTSAASQVIVNCGTGGASFGVSATAHVTTIGSTNTTSSTVIQSGTGDVVVTSTDDITIDSAGLLELNSSAGVIGIGNDADAYNINVGTGAAERIVTIGNATAATSVVLNVGTGNLDLGVNAIAHTTRLGTTTGAADTTLQAGTGAFTITAGGIYDVNATDALTIDSSAGTISIGADAIAQDINIGIGAAARTITIGNVTAASATVVNVGTGASSFAANATDHTTNVGSATGVSATTVSAGTGGLVLAAAGNVDIQPATGSAAANSITLNGKVTVATLTGQTTASAAQETFTITNNEISATSGLIVSVSNVGVNDARMTKEQVKPAAGSVEIKTQNNGGAALNGDVIISIIVLN